MGESQDHYQIFWAWGQAQTPIDKQESTTKTIVQKGSTRPTLKVGQIDFNVSG
jgi:hypothetical protein